jgi:hypothetical protein
LKTNSLEADSMRQKFVAVFVLLVVSVAVGLAGMAQDAPTEAPAGFDTPTLVQNPGSQSHSNGIAQPAGDAYANDQKVYETTHDPSTGLKPVFNAKACSDCHQNPVSGGASQFTELRVGHLDANGNFANPTIPINDGANTIGGRSIVNDRAVVPEAQEHIPATENIRALRAALNTLGDGFVEAIDDATRETIAQNQPLISDGRIPGEAIQVPIFEAPNQTRVGRFGWKDQHGSLLSFIPDAYLNEMGVTSRLRPKDTTTIGKITRDPEDVPDNLWLADIDHFAQFIRGTKVPPRDTTLAGTTAVQVGQDFFEKLGCSTCHVGSMRQIAFPVGCTRISALSNRHRRARNGDQWRHVHRTRSTGQQNHSPLQRFSATRHRDRRRHRASRPSGHGQQVAHRSVVGSAHAAALYA